MNITGQSSDLVDIINLKEYLPANVRLADKSFDGKITATVYIEPIATKDLVRTGREHYDQRCAGGNGGEITTEAETYDITVSGLDRDISILRDDTVTGVLDLEKWMDDNNVEELTPGNYTIPVTFNLSEDIMVENDVNIHIRLKNQDTNN